MYYLDKLNLCLKALMVSLTVIQITAFVLLPNLACHTPIDDKWLFHSGLKCLLSRGGLANTIFIASNYI